MKNIFVIFFALFFVSFLSSPVLGQKTESPDCVQRLIKLGELNNLQVELSTYRSLSYDIPEMVVFSLSGDYTDQAFFWIHAEKNYDIQPHSFLDGWYLLPIACQCEILSHDAYLVTERTCPDASDYLLSAAELAGIDIGFDHNYFMFMTEDEDHYSGDVFLGALGSLGLVVLTSSESGVYEYGFPDDTLFCLSPSDPSLFLSKVDRQTDDVVFYSYVDIYSNSLVRTLDSRGYNLLVGDSSDYDLSYSFATPVRADSITIQGMSVIETDAYCSSLFTQFDSHPTWDEEIPLYFECIINLVFDKGTPSDFFLIESSYVYADSSILETSAYDDFFETTFKSLESNDFVVYGSELRQAYYTISFRYNFLD